MRTFARLSLGCLLALGASLAAATAHADPAPRLEGTALGDPSSPPRLIDVPTAPLAAAWLVGGVSHRGDPLLAGELGLAGTAAIGFAIDDRVRVGPDAHDARTSDVAPGQVAWFRIGLDRDRLFAHQPALDLSFLRNFHDDHGLRWADLRLTATERLVNVFGGTYDLTAGVELADAKAADVAADWRLRERVRPFAGVAWTPTLYPRTSLLADAGYALSVLADQPTLTWTLGWGARYQVTRWSTIDLLVRHREDAGLEGSTVMMRATLVLR